MLKKKLLKRAGVIVLTMAMILSLASCGKDKEADGQGSGNGSSVEAEQYGGKEYVYAASFMKLDFTDWMDSSVIVDNTLFFASGKYDNATKKYTHGIYKADLSEGKVEAKPTNYLMVSGPDDTESKNLMGLAVLSDKTMMITETIYGEDGSKFFLTHLDENGDEISSKEITEDVALDDVDYSYPYELLALPDDTVVACDDENCAWKFDKDGNLVTKVRFDNLGWIDRMGITGDGTIAVAVWGDNGQVFKKLNFDSGKLEDWVDLKVAGSYGYLNINSILSGKNGETYLSTYDGVYSLNTETGECTEVFNWVDSDIIGNSVRNVFCDAEDEFGAITGEYIGPNGDQSEYEIAVLRKTATADLPKKEIITLGLLDSGASSDSAIVKFNRHSDKYRVETKKYFDTTQDFDSGEAYSEAMNKAVEAFNNDLLNGKAPDVIESLNLNVDRLTSKGLLEDLNKYLDSDPDISRDDYFESVLESRTSRQGVLYSIPSTFAVSTLMGWAEDLGDKEGWTVSEAKEIFEKNKGREYCKYTGRQSALAMFLYTNYSNFIDWNEGKCNFNSQDFIDLINITAMFPKDDDNIDWEEYDPYSGISDHSDLLCEADFSSITDYLLYKQVFNGGEGAVYKGYPGSAGNGTKIMPIDGFSIYSGSEKKEAAWEFVKSFISKDYYNSANYYSFPSLKSAYNEMMDKASHPDTYINEDGEEESLGTMTYGFGNQVYEIGSPTEDDVKAMTELIENASGEICYDTFVYGIIEEEIGAVFEGNKTAEDAAAIIQSRIQTYVDESR